MIPQPVGWGTVVPGVSPRRGILQAPPHLVPSSGPFPGRPSEWMRWEAGERKNRGKQGMASRGSGRRGAKDPTLTANEPEIGAPASSPHLLFADPQIFGRGMDGDWESLLKSAVGAGGLLREEAVIKDAAVGRGAGSARKGMVGAGVQDQGFRSEGIMQPSVMPSIQFGYHVQLVMAGRKEVWWLSGRGPPLEKKLKGRVAVRGGVYSFKPSRCSRQSTRYTCM